MNIRDRRGFTLIELMVVTVVIGILVAIVVPQFYNLKTKSFDSEAKADIRNMIATQNVYFADQQAYASAAVPTSGRADLNGDGVDDYQASGGITLTVTAYTDGYQITAQHLNSPNAWCVNTSGTNNSSGTPGLIVKTSSC